MTTKKFFLTTTSLILKIVIYDYFIAKTHWCKFLVCRTNTFRVIGGKVFGGDKKNFQKRIYFPQDMIKYNMLYMVEIRKEQRIQIKY